MILSNRQLALIFTIVLFVGVIALAISRLVTYNDTHYQVGNIPAEVVNRLVPRDVPLTAMRPPAIRLNDPLRFGNATSLISVIEYGDYECDYCRKMHDVVQNVLAPYHGMVRFLWRDFPIEEQHPHALAAAVFARCAGAQGKYWEAYDALMASATLDESALSRITTELRLDDPRMRACRADPAVTTAVRDDEAEARADGIKSTPLIFIGTTAVEGYQDEQTLKTLIDKALAS